MSNTENKSPEAAPRIETSGAEVNGVPVITRRRLFKAGLTATPVVMTLASRPVLAWHCSTASAMASINVSHKQTCTTKEFYSFCVKEWRDKCNSTQSGAWPSACGSKNATFSSCLGSGSTTQTVKQCLNSTNSSGKFDRIFLAAYLNCKAGIIDPVICIDVPKLRTMYKDGKLNVFKPYGTSSTIIKNQAWCLDYLRENWIAVENTGDWNGTWNCHS